MAITIISYPNNNLNESIIEPTSLDSAELVQYVMVKVADAGDDEYIEIVFNGVITTLLITDECRYTPIDIAFLNKEGAEQFITFFKAKETEINITKEEYEFSGGEALAGYHQVATYNVNAKEKFKINSGFVDESMNNTFRELLLSSKVWSYVNEIYTPLKVSTSSLTYKTRQKERLINYEITFDDAFNTINNQ